MPAAFFHQLQGSRKLGVNLNIFYQRSLAPHFNFANSTRLKNIFSQALDPLLAKKLFQQFRTENRFLKY